LGQVKKSGNTTASSFRKIKLEAFHSSFQSSRNLHNMAQLQPLLLQDIT
jgi:hypothetical protein